MIQYNIKLPDAIPTFKLLDEAQVTDNTQKF